MGLEPQFKRMTLDELINELIEVAGRRPGSYGGESPVAVMDVYDGGPARKFLAVDIEDDGSITISGFDSAG